MTMKVKSITILSSPFSPNLIALLAFIKVHHGSRTQW